MTDRGKKDLKEGTANEPTNSNEGEERNWLLEGDLLDVEMADLDIGGDDLIIDENG